MGADQERAWVLATLGGDHDAFAKLVEVYQGPVYNLAYRMLGTAADAEDATQESFLRAYTRLDTYDPGRKFSSWILSVASHYCVDRLRRRRGRNVSMEDVRGWRWIPDDDPKPEEYAARHEREATIRRMLGDLPPQYRLVIVLRYWQDLSYEEIAEITESTQSAIKSRLHRARRMMAEMIREADPELGAAHDRGAWRSSENALSRSF